jgi:ribosomal protein L31
VLSIDDVERAARTISGRVHRTPLLRSATLSAELGAEIYFKAELFQRTGSFKVRGALNRIAELTPEERARGVITISAGNHAQAVAWAAREAGLDALVVSWKTADALKMTATRGYGATVDQHAESPTAAFDRLTELHDETGRTLVHPFDDLAVMAGQGTVGLEVLEDAPAADVVLVPVGGGGLVSGIATAVKARRPAARVRGGRARALAGAPEGPRGGPLRAGDAAERGGRAQCAVRGRALHPDLRGARRRVRARRRGGARRCLSLGLRANEACVRARRGRLGGGASLRSGARRARADGGRRRLGRQRGAPGGRCYPDSMKADIHPEYVLSTVTCSCGNTFQTRSTQAELHVEVCSNCHPFYTGKQKLMDSGGRVERFQKRLERAERAKRGSRS